MGKDVTKIMLFLCVLLCVLPLLFFFFFFFNKLLQARRALQDNF